MKTMWVALIGVCLLAGCAKDIPVTTTKAAGAPEWIDNEVYSEEQISVVGIAQRNPLDDKSMQRTEALADARIKLAQKISVRVQEVFAQLNRRLSAGNRQSDGEAAVSTDVMTRMIEDTRRQVVDLELHGAAPQQFWTDPADGTLYVLVLMSHGRLDSAISSAASQVIRKELDQGSRDLQEALLRMDETLKNQRN